MRGKLLGPACFLVALALVSPPGLPSATPLAVRHREGTAHGFVVVRSTDGKILGTGDMIQTVDGYRVSSELDIRFKDGSIYEEHTEFTQQHVLKLLSDHLR